MVCYTYHDKFLYLFHLLFHTLKARKILLIQRNNHAGENSYYNWSEFFKKLFIRYASVWLDGTFLYH